jgi:hypothetical protein
VTAIGDTNKKRQNIRSTSKEVKIPPHYHMRNAAERATMTFKENFVAELSSVDPDSPMHLWYLLLPQA